MRFKDEQVRFASGVAGRHIDIPSASPRNFYQVISAPEEMPKLTIEGKLFLPNEGGGPFPLVMVCPGSLGVAPSHLAHAETLCDQGFATFVLDSFGARAITSTVANQTQFSFAASAYDVLAAFNHLSEFDEIDETRIGAQGHSRGGSAVLNAATRRFADAVIGRQRALKGVLAAYPWSGHQFLDPSVADTEIRVLMGDRDDWCSPAQVQSHMQAIRLTSGSVTMLLLGGAGHGFDRGPPFEDIPDAVVATAAPTAYMTDDGAMIHPLRDQPDASLAERDIMVYALKAGFGNYGATVGGTPEEAKVFRDEMVSFWRRVLVKKDTD